MNVHAVVFLLMLIISFSVSTVVITAEDDTTCLKQFLNSVGDPADYLAVWIFGDADLCTFIGIECWNQEEDKVVSLKLPKAGLTGTFPRGLAECQSLTGLDLSGNSFTGPIPTDICDQLPYLTTLDLSGNGLIGEIPSNLGNCIYLSILKLQNNNLSGSIPSQIGTLTRLTSLNLSHNSLSGEIPSALANLDASAFSGNSDLCGAPLAECIKPAVIFTPVVITGIVLGSALMLSIPIWVFWVILARRKRRQLKQLLIEAQLMRIEVFREEAPPPYVKLNQKELLEATTNYSEENAIGRGGSSTVYRAILQNGDLIAVKRFDPGFDFPKFDKQNIEEALTNTTSREVLINTINTRTSARKQFLTELAVLGKLRHRNLLRIRGYCYNHLDCMAIIMDYMPGSLHDILHSTDPCRKFNFGWKMRLEILIGIAEGLSYLHSEYDGKSRVVHGDLKPANVLLDEDMSPHIADFGLASMVGAIDSLYSCTHLYNSASDLNQDGASASALALPSALASASSVNRPWSFGYTAPECALQGSASVKADVFSFGVVILEVITGERPSSDNLKEGQTLADWVSEALEMNSTDNYSPRTSVENVVAEELRGVEIKQRGEQIEEVLRLGCRCASPAAHRRPRIGDALGLLHKLNNNHEDGLLACRNSEQTSQQ